MLCDLVKDEEKEIIGEYTALKWNNIVNLFDFIPNSQAIHVIRDPRAVLSSWKKLSSIPNNAYLNCIFNWLEFLIQLKTTQSLEKTNTNLLSMRI